MKIEPIAKLLTLIYAIFTLALSKLVPKIHWTVRNVASITSHYIKQRSYHSKVHHIRVKQTYMRLVQNYTKKKSYYLKLHRKKRENANNKTNEKILNDFWGVWQKRFVKIIDCYLKCICRQVKMNRVQEPPMALPDWWMAHIIRSFGNLFEIM